MSIVLLVDGYNVIAPVAPPGRGRVINWLAAERQRLLERLTEHLEPAVRSRTCVIFDAKHAPPDRPSRFQHHGIEVRFATEYPEADDLLEEIILSHPTPRNLTVVSSDHRIQAVAKRRRATPFDSAAWLDGLLEGDVELVWYPKAKPLKNGGTSDAGDDTPSAGGPSLPTPIRSEPVPNEIDQAVDALIDDDDLDDLLREAL